MEKTIRIAFRPGPLLSHHDIHAFQDDLKEINEAELNDLEKEIIDTGFAFAPDIWKDPVDGLWKIIDAHTRKLALIRLEEKGYAIPKLHTIEVLANSREEAKRRVLQRNSSYAKMTERGLAKFSTAAGIPFAGLSSFRFAGLKLEKVGMHMNPNFGVGNREGQGELDKKLLEETVITCPHCQQKFTR